MLKIGELVYQYYLYNYLHSFFLKTFLKIEENGGQMEKKMKF